MKDLLLNIVTGGGKTVIIGAAIAWLKMAYDINKFLIIVPNLIVRDRLELDFQTKDVFRKFELFPKHLEEQYLNELDSYTLEAGKGPQGIMNSGVILGNIQQFYSSNISGQRNLAYIMNFVDKIAVFNDEAHNTPALDDKIIKSVVVYEPEIKIVELTYTNKETGEKRKVTELDKEFEEAEKQVKPFQWILDPEPMKKQIAMALQRLEEQKRRAKERYKPVLFVVTMSISEGERAQKMLQNDFKINTLLVTEESEDTDRKEAASPVYGQQVIGRGLRRIIRDTNESEILAVVDHPRLQHDWLWRLVAVSKIRQNVQPDDLFGDEDLQEKFKMELLSVASGLLMDAGFGGMKKGKLYSAMMDHIIKKIFNGKDLKDTHKMDIEFALDNMEQIRKNFSKPIVAGILR